MHFYRILCVFLTSFGKSTVRSNEFITFQEKDIHSGLIGPILVCQKGTFSKSNNSKTSTRDFFLLFMVFDEEKSWYFDKRSRSPCTEKTQERQQCHKFYGTYLILPSIQFVVVEGKVLGEVSQLTEFLNTHKSYTLIM